MSNWESRSTTLYVLLSMSAISTLIFQYELYDYDIKISVNVNSWRKIFTTPLMTRVFYHHFKLSNSYGQIIFISFKHGREFLKYRLYFTSNENFINFCNWFCLQLSFPEMLFQKTKEEKKIVVCTVILLKWNCSTKVAVNHMHTASRTTVVFALYKDVALCISEQEIKKNNVNFMAIFNIHIILTVKVAVGQYFQWNIDAQRPILCNQWVSGKRKQISSSNSIVGNSVHYDIRIFVFQQENKISHLSLLIRKKHPHVDAQNFIVWFIKFGHTNIFGWLFLLI